MTDYDSSILQYSLTERWKFHSVMFIYKILKKSATVYLHNMFEYAINVTGSQAEILINFLYHKIILIMEGVVYTTEEQLCGMLYHIHDTATFTKRLLT